MHLLSLLVWLSREIQVCQAIHLSSFHSELPAHYSVTTTRTWRIPNLLEPTRREPRIPPSTHPQTGFGPTRRPTLISIGSCTNGGEKKFSEKNEISGRLHQLFSRLRGFPRRLQRHQPSLPRPQPDLSLSPDVQGSLPTMTRRRVRRWKTMTTLSVKSSWQSHLGLPTS